MTKITENDIELWACNTVNVNLKQVSIKGFNTFFSSFS